jgi:hypothetical protein
MTRFRNARSAAGVVARRALEPGLSLADRLTERREAARWRASGGTRESAPFVRELVLGSLARDVEIEGRRYTYVLYPGRGDSLGIHFSAFFGEWGERREHRAQYQGYFHRLRMFWPLAEHAFLFVCDTFGADANGTYYKGENGDFFVERAIDAILDGVHEELAIPPQRTVTLGSSMGATGALRFALERGYAGAIGVSPHIDLDLSARYQGRSRHVAAIVGRDDVESPELFGVTREIRALAGTVAPTPRIVLQSMRDDHGVHAEQVLPFVEQWRGRGGEVLLDERPTGGHTSEHATPEWFAAQLEWCLRRDPR